jgi:3-deoxy-D-arabino-heptulosonate 7-phosphate (DAHP) synthase class II
MDKEEAISVLDEIKENVSVCCAITMEPDEVLELIDKLEEFIQNLN